MKYFLETYFAFSLGTILFFQLAKEAVLSRLGIVYLWISLWLRVYFNLWLMHSFKVDLHDLRQRAKAARNPKSTVATKRHASPLPRV